MFFILLIYKISWCVLDIKPLLNVLKIFFSVCGLSINFLHRMFWRLHVSNFEHLSFFINIQVFYVFFNKSLPIWRLLRYSHMFSSRTVTVSSFMFCLGSIYLELIFASFFTQISNYPKYYKLKKFSCIELELTWLSPLSNIISLCICQVYFLTLFCTIDLFHFL